MIKKYDKLFLTVLLILFFMVLGCLVLFRCLGIGFGTVSLSDIPKENDLSFIYDGKLNINEATPEQLSQLPGIGPTLSERIVTHRENYGKFKNADDLLKIKGMNKNIVDEIESYISFGGVS